MPLIVHYVFYCGTFECCESTTVILKYSPTSEDHAVDEARLRGWRGCLQKMWCPRHRSEFDVHRSECEALGSVR